MIGLVFILLCIATVALANYGIRVDFGSDFPKGLPPLQVIHRFMRLKTTTPLLVSLGLTPRFSACNVSVASVQALGSEAYLIVQPVPGFICVLGNAGAANALNAPTTVNRGLLYGTYALLSLLGVHFLHPLEPTFPAGAVDVPQMFQMPIQSAPHFSVRAFHYHTEHPLELCEFLQGVDSGAETWDSMVPQFESWVEWLVANRANAFEFVLLDWKGVDPWSTQRQNRLRSFVTGAQAWGIAVGADFAIAEKQQHAWHMVHDADQTHAQIRRAVDWIAAANFSFIATENGDSEFTHTLCADMLAWMNYLDAYARDAHGLPVFIKAHCSTGQTCPTHNDPRTNQPVNFNFLPMLANKSLGVMPHTVQYYRLDDPAPTYGNTNFSYMLDFLLYERATGRPTIYHPETAYWVNFDINVPLLLPIYADTRIYDVQLIRDAEFRGAKPIDGQMVFTSGWEWGYWMNDVIAARTAWDAVDSTRATADIMADYLQPMAQAMFDDSNDQASFVQLVLDTVAAERKLLVQGVTPFNPSGTGAGFLCGWDTWASLAQLLGSYGVKFAQGALTNANKVSFDAVRDGTDEPKYAVFAPLLSAMATQFDALQARYSKLLGRAIDNGLMLELTQAMQMTALRAAQVELLYKYVKFHNQSDLTAAHDIMVTAQLIVNDRMSHYRAPIERIAGWRANPTAYNFGYLWSAKSLQYWWRDFQIARDRRWLDESPCLDNIVDPVDMAIGEGIADSIVRILYEVLKYIPYSSIFDDCLHEPLQEPHYSQ